jgi:hypothetical protein
VSAKSVFIPLAVVSILSLVCANSVSAEDKITAPAQSPSANKIAPSGPKIEKLTSQECEGLGGKVVKVETPLFCANMCEVADAAGVVRSTCIDEIRH